MLLSLNDDCLRMILELLELDEQVKMAHQCHRLKEVTESIWRHNCKKVRIKSRHWRYFRDFEDQFFEYMRCISDQVETLNFGRSKPLFVNGLKNTRFPNVHTFSIKVDYSGVSAVNRNLQITNEMFPKLMSFTCFGDLNSANLHNFQNLEELNLYNCNKLQPEFLTRIFSCLSLKKLTIHFVPFSNRYYKAWESITKCTTLTELCIDVRYMYRISDHLFKMKNLRKMSFFTKDTLHSRECTYGHLSEIISQWNSNIEAVVMAFTYKDMRDYWYCLCAMPSLRRLVIIGNISIRDNYFKKISKWLAKSLQEFYFVANTYSVSFPNVGLLEVVRRCTNLELFDLSGTQIDVSFVESVAEIIRSQCGKRKQTLLLRCHNTRVNIEDLEALSLPTEMQVSLKKGQIQYPKGPCMECERSL